eukprot:107433_1
MSWRCRLSKNLQELRIHFCQTSASSQGMRQFVRQNYPDLKALNPGLPILIRECSNVKPALWARYDWGEERKATVTDFDETKILAELHKLVDQGEIMPRSDESLPPNNWIV